MSRVRIAAIIPARLASSRFPGKPLLEVGGLPMIEHVRRRTVLCRGFTEVVVATCDEEIAQVVRRFGGRVVMTAAHHPAATDRVAEAAQQVDCTHVVNVQGDELLVLPSDLQRMVEAMTAEPDVCAWNAVARLEASSELSDHAIVKCVVSVSGRILYCARDLSHAAFSDRPGFGAVRAILGILGYRRDFLSRYAELRRTPIEEASAIDQSRIIEHDIALRSVEFSKSYRGINEPREVELVQACLDDDPAQHAVLREIAHT